ncbi:translation initiation factor SUI1 [Anaeromyxobacter dehalogenans 2CP-1]|uniref:Translation initiation factor SUI1 n=1 Tax=Anaeromyxobacter dehalogenans (strain ATCC BAA-258 / DSM 21875 / 2CP-1) TaxID=455488 RepID=B8JED5_ANAD2|nr:translation initiation factor [Anaeromyxobacter dehalogenans]ACL64261.1 translation initiation factor SUI1 [Anaeromyxobacter dehalogenans 2CP-1]
MSKKKAPPVDAPAGPFNAAFEKLRAQLPPDHVPAPEPAPPPAAAPTPASAPARAVVRLERKGRGGKEATVVEKLALAPRPLAEWADSLKRALGCGGGVEGDAIVLQGDQRDRAVAWLERRGVRKVIRG